MKRCVSKGKSLPAVRGRRKERTGADAKSRAQHRLRLGKVFAKNEWDICSLERLQDSGYLKKRGERNALLEGERKTKNKKTNLCNLLH